MSKTRVKTAVNAATAQVVATSGQRRARQESSSRSRKTIEKLPDPRIEVNEDQQRRGLRRKTHAVKRSRSNLAGSTKKSSTNIIITRARGSTSSGSSGPTGASGSGSSGSTRVSQDSNSSASAPPRNHTQRRSDHTDPKEVSKDAIRRSGSVRKPICRKQVTKVVVSDSFTEFRITRGSREVRILVGEDASISAGSNVTPDNPESCHRGQENPCSTAIKTGRVIRSGQSQPQLSPQSLRRARLRVLEKTRKYSSTSSTSLKSLLAGVRRGSTLLPQQHYCGPSVRGHYDAPVPQRSEHQIHTEQSGSPDPGSPHPGGGSASPEHWKKQKKAPHKARFRIANMGVSEIVDIVTSQSYSFRLVPISNFHELDLDEAARAYLNDIAKRRHGTTASGMGPWNRIDKCSKRLDWDSWCCLSRSPESIHNDRCISASDAELSPPNTDLTHIQQENVLLVPLTSSQTELLRNRLREVPKGH